MNYSPARTQRLIRETDRMGTHATTAEVERANQLSAAHDQLEKMAHLLRETRQTMHPETLAAAKGPSDRRTLGERIDEALEPWRTLDED